eukprot:CAMPEP_0114683880 /NCGR_PEP_ID=MMETSP0191-20121206/58383_1 /TAXON_ID=126664 /ORGANISM="Sorites sp." /LENGTH=37 /DNA_ID= /DNA_START= /DNA_END= /DNA_ORIENTATION=
MKNGSRDPRGVSPKADRDPPKEEGNSLSLSGTEERNE